MLRVSTCFYHCSSCAKHVDSASVSVVEGWCEFSFRRKLKKASFNGDSNEQIINVKKKFMSIIENKWDIKYIQILPGIGEGLHHDIFIT